MAAGPFKFYTLPVDAELYRMDNDPIQPSASVSRASNVYTRRDKATYFLLSAANTHSYDRMYTFRKQFRVTEALNLLDMNDVATRELIESRLVAPDQLNALRTAFPIAANRNTVKRYSSPNTKVKDDIALAAICSLGFDGYYTRRQEAESEMNVGFHAEVGLCPSAFGRLAFVSNVRVSAPNVKKNTRRRRNMMNNSNSNSNSNTNSNSNNYSRSRTRRFRWSNSNSNSNTNENMSPPNIRRGGLMFGMNDD
jgi:hypothetical protein